MLAVLALLACAAFPIYWMLVTSLTPSADLFAARPRFLPTLDQFGVYKEVFTTIPVATWLANSAIVATGTMALSIALAILPAYALSRFRFRGKGLLGFTLFVTQMLPEAMLVVPLYAIFAQLALLNTLTGLILANAAFTVPVITWILKGAVDGVPIDIEEAARIDGCSQIDIVLTVVIPLVGPTLAAAAVIAFFHGWNEYVFAQTLVSSQELRTASVGLAGFVGELSTPVHSVMAIGLDLHTSSSCSLSFRPTLRRRRHDGRQRQRLTAGNFSMASITLKHVTKTWGSVPAVNDVDLAVADGEFLVLLGPSGCGKSTLLRMLAGLETVSSGEIHLEGRRVDALPPSARDMAFVFQSYALYPHMTVQAEHHIPAHHAAVQVVVPPAGDRRHREAPNRALAGGEGPRRAHGENIWRSRRCSTAILARFPAASGSASPSAVPWSGSRRSS